jgi:hypothetical protein
MAEDEQTTLRMTIAHVQRFPVAKLRRYEAKLREMGARTSIKWQHLDPRGGQLRADTQVEQLRLADAVASGTAEAFNPNPFGQTEQRYLRELVPRLYESRRGGPRNLPSYGLKMHPWNDAAKALYPWVLEL